METTTATTATTAKTQKSNVMKDAWYLVKTIKISISEGLKSAWKALKTAKMIAKMELMEFFKITFAKKETGEITTRVGSNAKQKNNCLMFFSLTDNGFRMAIIDNIISVEATEVQISVVA